MLKKLLSIAESIYEQFQNGEIPEINLTRRTKKNIEFDSFAEVWKYGGTETKRSAKTVRGAYQLLKTVYLIDFLKYQSELDKTSTLRELYYISENWDLAKFSHQDESNRLIEDLEIITDLQREEFHIRPEEDGASVFGPVEIEELTRRGKKRINCQDDVGESGYQIPANVDLLRFVSHDAKFVVGVETGGMKDRLIENKFDERYDAIIVHLKGQPARSTRRLIKRMNEELSLPVLIFTDGDPWSYRIYASVAYGAIKSAHLSIYLATPKARFIGIKPSDIINYRLPSEPLSSKDIAELNSELSDPRFSSDFWQSEIKLQLKLGKKSEQQSLAKYGLDYVTDRYLPERLRELGL
jgi:DNA topoisomerase-6 subunit A